MNKLSLFVYPAIALLSLAAAFSAHAEGPMAADNTASAWSQAKTRAQVQAELLQARADGSYQLSSENYSLRLVSGSEKTRAQVRAEFTAPRQADATRGIVGEDGGSFAAARVRQARPARDSGRVLAGSAATGAQQ